MGDQCHFGPPYHWHLGNHGGAHQGQCVNQRFWHMNYTFTWKTFTRINWIYTCVIVLIFIAQFGNVSVTNPSSSLLQHPLYNLSDDSLHDRRDCVVVDALFVHTHQDTPLFPHHGNIGRQESAKFRSRRSLTFYLYKENRKTNHKWKRKEWRKHVKAGTDGYYFLKEK